MLLITRFNKLIRNKVVWAVFAFIVVISFILGSSVRGCSRRSTPTAEHNYEGTLFGKPVSQDEFYWARRFVMKLSPISDLDEETSKRLREHTWMRLAALRRAEELGLTPSNDEVTRAIHGDRSFAEQGVFSQRRYVAILDQVGIQNMTFRDYVRQDLALRQLTAMLNACVWVAPYEVQESLARLTDLFTVEYVAVTNRALVADIKADINDAREYYEENGELFREGEKMRVRYIACPVTSNDLAAVHVDEAEIQEEYTNRIDEYTSTDTNGNSVVTPFDKVRDEIDADIRHDIAFEAKRDVATEFTYQLVSDGVKAAPTFDEAAKASNWTIHTSEFFTVSSPLTNLAVDLEFNRTAFDLDVNDPVDYFDTVTGKDAVYILAAGEHKESRIPPLEEILDQVLPLAQREAEKQTFLDDAYEIRDGVCAALKEGKTFADGIQGEGGLHVTTTQPFCVYGDIGHDQPFVQPLSEAVATLMPGDTAEPIQIPDGALVACVVRREPGDIAAAASIRPFMLAKLDSYRGSILFEEWATKLLKEADLHDEGADEADTDGES